MDINLGTPQTLTITLKNHFMLWKKFEIFYNSGNFVKKPTWIISWFEKLKTSSKI